MILTIISIQSCTCHGGIVPVLYNTYRGYDKGISLNPFSHGDQRNSSLEHRRWLSPAPAQGFSQLYSLLQRSSRDPTSRSGRPWFSPPFVAHSSLISLMMGSKLRLSTLAVPMIRRQKMPNTVFAVYTAKQNLVLSS
jgi:hypothetical protein